MKELTKSSLSPQGYKLQPIKVQSKTLKFDFSSTQTQYHPITLFHLSYFTTAPI